MNAELAFEPEKKPFRPALRYHGGKWTIAPWIISHFPEHRVYCEPFCGAASVLLRKSRSKIEVINDLDDEVTGLFEILRDKDASRVLCELIAFPPFSRADFKLAYEPAVTAIERARRLVVRSFFGFGSHSFNADNSNGFRSFICKNYASEWSGVPEALMAIVERINGVMVENRPALEVIAQKDSADTLFFIDPPYPTSTRDGNGKGYRFEMTDHNHRQLACFLKSVKGKVVLCGYPCDLYDVELFADWRRVEVSAYAGGQKGRVKRTEVLWMNFQ